MNNPGLYEEFYENIKDLEWMNFEQGNEIWHFIISNNIKNILELGFAFGKSTLVMAHSLEVAKTNGHIDTIDIEGTQRIFGETLEKNLKSLQLTEFVSIFRESHSYNWWLKKKIEECIADKSIKPVYDFVYIDGAHNWTVDLCAFALADRLLKPGGVMLFDDLKYNYYDLNKSQGKNNLFTLDIYDPRTRVMRTPMSDDELRACHVGLIYKLFVETHTGYDKFWTSQNGDWGWCRKRKI